MKIYLVFVFVLACTGDNTFLLRIEQKDYRECLSLLTKTLKELPRLPSGDLKRVYCAFDSSRSGP